MNQDGGQDVDLAKADVFALGASIYGAYRPSTGNCSTAETLSVHLRCPRPSTGNARFQASIYSMGGRPDCGVETIAGVL